MKNIKRFAAKVLCSDDISRFDIEKYGGFRKVFGNATVYVAGEADEFLIIESPEWESRFVYVGEYAE